jgi:hypothetical protein
MKLLPTSRARLRRGALEIDSCPKQHLTQIQFHGSTFAQSGRHIPSAIFSARRLQFPLSLGDLD